MSSLYGMGVKGNVDCTTNWIKTARKNAKDKGIELKEEITEIINKMNSIYQIGGKAAILEIYVLIGKESEREFDIVETLGIILEKLNG